jgi:protein-arginine kinase activator protein McsA
MLPKASSLKRAVLTQKEHEIQLGLEIEDNNNAIDIRDQIWALAAN